MSWRTSLTNLETHMLSLDPPLNQRKLNQRLSAEARRCHGKGLRPWSFRSTHSDHETVLVPVNDGRHPTIGNWETSRVST